MAENVEYMDIVEAIENNEVNERPERVIRDRLNPIEEFSDETFLNRFRFPKAVVVELLEELLTTHEFDDPQKKITSIPAINQLLLTLHFYSSSCFLRTDGDVFGVSKSSTSRIIKKCSAAIASLKDRYISFPNENELQGIKTEFFNIARMPNIVGAIDCTHIPILSPGKDQAELYRNRKGFYSINVQVIGDANLLVRNIVARWPGSTHDSRIFDNSVIADKFENGEIDGILVGDNGYALKPYLLTPLLNPTTPAQRRYNYVHCQTRVKIENLFGLMKSRFPCLALKLRLKKQTSLTVIIACAVLHNLARIRNIPNEVPPPNGPEDVPVLQVDGNDVRGAAQRSRMIELLSRQ